MTNNQNDSSKGGGFFNGFLLGALIGGGAVFLLGTKKGKKLLKIITEGGLEGISEIEDVIEDMQEEKELDQIQQQPIPHGNGLTKKDTVSEETQSPLSKLKTTGKRFFKGIPKRG